MDGKRHKHNYSTFIVIILRKVKSIITSISQKVDTSGKIYFANRLSECWIIQMIIYKEQSNVSIGYYCRFYEFLITMTAYKITTQFILSTLIK